MQNNDNININQLHLKLIFYLPKSIISFLAKYHQANP